MLSPADQCPKCESLLSTHQTHCTCGRPTSQASFADRAAYEVSQWRAYQETAATATA